MTDRREAVLRAIVQSTPVATIAVDPQGIVHVWNRAAEDMFGWRAADIVGASPPFSLGNLVARALQEDEIAPTRVQYARRDGAPLDVEVRCGPLRDDSGRVVGAVLVCTDVTADQRASEHALEETRAALARAEDMQRAPVAEREIDLNKEADGDALIEAIKSDQLQLFFQPIVRLADAQCVGAEALVRWQDRERGLVSTTTIFSLADAYDLSDDLAGWMLERAIRQAARWQLEQDDFRIAIDLPVGAFAQTGLAVLVGALLRREGVAPESIDLEVAPSVIGDDAVAAAIEELRAVGVRVVATGPDDVDVTVDACKADCALVDKAVVERAHARGVRVIGDGVDTEAQLSALLESGCDEAQGNFFAPPQPASDLRTLVSPTRRWRPRGSPLMRRA